MKKAIVFLSSWGENKGKNKPARVDSVCSVSTQAFFIREHIFPAGDFQGMKSLWELLMPGDAVTCG